MGEQQHPVTRSFVYACIGAWLANSVVCVLLNKQVLFYKDFRFPTTLAAMHMASAFLTAGALIYGTKDGKQHLPPLGKAKPEFLMHLVGIAALYGAVLVLANAAFIYLSVPSIQMLKSLGPATTYLVGLILGTEAYANRSMFKVLVVGIGVAVASYGDIRANILGVCMQMGSIVADATRATLLQHVMQKSEVKLSPIGTLFCVSPLAALCLCLPAAMLEASALLNHHKPIPWAWLLASCAAASSINLIVFTLIGKTSALTTSITGPLKLVATIGGSMIAFGTPITPLQLCGYSIAMVGILWYQHEKFAGKRASAPPKGEKGGDPLRDERGERGTGGDRAGGATAAVERAGPSGGKHQVHTHHQVHHDRLPLLAELGADKKGSESV